MVSFLLNRQWMIAVIVGFLILLLSLGAVLLVFPALTTAQCEPQLTVQDVSTQDAGGTEQTAFAPGETIRFVAEVNNGYGGWLLGSNGTWLAVTTSFYSTTDSVDIPPGSSTWTWETTTPAEAGDYTVEVVVYDSFCGISGGLGTNFSVGEPEETPPPDAEPTATLLNPAEGPPGTEVTVTGSGWPPGDIIDVRWDTTLAQTTADDNGNIQVSFFVPADATEGEHDVFIRDGEPGKGGIDVHLPFRVTTPGDSGLVANAGPDQTVPGPSPVAVQFDGSGSTGDIVRYQWYNQYGLLLAEGVTPVIEVNFGHTDPQPGTQRTFTLVAEDSQGNTAQDEVTITLGETQGGEQPSCPEPTAMVSPSSASTGDTVTVQGAGWLPGGTVTFILTGPTQFDVGFLTVPDSGEWGGSFTVPELPAGDYELVLSENHEGCELTVTQPFTIESVADTEPPTVSWVKPEGIFQFENSGQLLEGYDAASGTIALEVAVSDNTGIRSVLFERWDAVNSQLIELGTDTAAPYQASVAVNELNMEWNQIRAVAEDTAGNLTELPLFIFRLNPTITLDLTEGPRGTEVTVQGSGWVSGDTVSIQFAESGNVVTQVTVGDDGSFTATFPVPADAAFGEQKVIATTENVTTENGFWETDANFLVTEPEQRPTPTPTPEPTPTPTATPAPTPTPIPADTEPPTVSWVKPVGNGAVYQAASGTVELEVTASDSSGIHSVEFYRYDSVNDQLVRLITDSSAPYQASVTVDTLHMKLNGIVAVAVDTAGNRSRGTESIFIYRLNPAITLDPTGGSQSKGVAVKGTGWFPGDTVIINLGEPPSKVGQATVDGDGNFTAKFTVPANAVIGEQKVIATTPDGLWQTDAVFQVKEKPPVPILTITNTAAWKSATAGTKFLYHIRVTNNGAADATGVKLTVNVPLELAPIINNGLQFSQGNCPYPPPQFQVVVNCDLRTLPAGESANVFILVGVTTARETQPGKITSSAVVTSDQNTKGNEAVSTIEIVESPKLKPEEIAELETKARICGGVFIGPPFFGLVVDEIFDAYHGNKITEEEAAARLRQAILDLITVLEKDETKKKRVKVLSTFFNTYV